jgi:hypothetical protein
VRGDTCDATFYRLSLPKGEGRVRVRRYNAAQSEPLTSILSPSRRGEADGEKLGAPTCL